jgi:4-hydroxyphenylpyruvate dioxygenase-like putative hemolysin
MQIIDVDRVVLAVPNIDESTEKFSKLLGIDFSDQIEPTTSTTKGEHQLTNVISSTGIELVTPRDEDNALAQFIEENGSGLYAMAIRVADIEEAKEELAEHDVHPVGEFSFGDVVEIMYHPRDFEGAMVLMAEYDAPHPCVSAAQGRTR